MKIIWIVVMTLALALAGGCTQRQQAEVQEATKGARQAASNVALETKVKTALATRKGLDGTAINVEARGSAVTLKGDVATRAQAGLAEKVARETEGVESVTNELMLRIPAKPKGG